MGGKSRGSHARGAGLLSRPDIDAPPDPVARAHARIAAARTRLVLDRPFLGALALHLVPVATSADRCDTLGTDGRRLWFHPQFVADLSQAHLRFWIAHVALHCALGHFARRQHRVRARWDVACDHAVNLLLREDGLILPGDAVADRAFADLSAEQIYPLVPEATQDVPVDHHDVDHEPAGGGLAGYLDEVSIAQGKRGSVTSASTGSTGDPTADDGSSDDDGWDDAGNIGRKHRPHGDRDASTMGCTDPHELEQLWKSRLATAAQAAREAGRLGQSWQRVLERLIEPVLPWRALLARYVVSAAREDYTFQRPPRRDGVAILPRLARGSLRIVAVLDTSGSITRQELAEFAAELDALKAQVRAEVTVHACDERLAPEGPWHFDPWDTVTLPESLPGGGGTRFTPVFEWIDQALLAPDLLIYFTDAQGEFPSAPPPYPVLWLVKGRGEVPFGERVGLG
jgi:predicted metal-dependent peptidase